MIEVQLPTEVEDYARRCVAEGRYADLGEVVTSALNLLRAHDYTKESFAAMLDEAEAEGDRDGWVSMEEMSADLNRIIEEVEQQKR